MLHGVAIERGAACGDLKSAQSAYRVELKHIRFLYSSTPTLLYL